MPNPFRETVTLSVSLAERLPMELGIYSVDGRRVQTLARGEREPGNYRFTWDGRDENGNPMAAGIFYARFTAGRAEFTRRMTYLR
jgi:flagellar hook assembly protein FlgD